MAVTVNIVLDVQFPNRDDLFQTLRGVYEITCLAVPNSTDNGIHTFLDMIPILAVTESTPVYRPHILVSITAVEELWKLQYNLPLAIHTIK